MKVKQLISNLESQLRKLKAMKDVEQTDVLLQVTDADGYSDGYIHLVDFGAFFNQQEDNNITIDVEYEKNNE